MERWTASWGHVFVSAPLPPLTRTLAEQTATRLGKQISVLQPMVVEAAVPAGTREHQSSSRKRWNRRSAS